MSWRGLLIAYGVICFVTLSVAIFLAFHGLPLVLPLSGIELLLLGFALYSTANQGKSQEVVTIKHDAIVFEAGRNYPESSHEFQRPWAKIVLERPWHAWYPSKLLIRSHGRQIEVGKFLNEEERKGLAEQLSLAMHAYN